MVTPLNHSLLTILVNCACSPCWLTTCSSCFQVICYGETYVNYQCFGSQQILLPVHNSCFPTYSPVFSLHFHWFFTPLFIILVHYTKEDDTFGIKKAWICSYLAYLLFHNINCYFPLQHRNSSGLHLPHIVHHHVQSLCCNFIKMYKYVIIVIY